MTSMYSIYVLLVHLIVTITSIYQGVNYIMGFLGVANLALLFVIVLFFKSYLLEAMANNAKTLRIDGYSEFNLVYNKAK